MTHLIKHACCYATILFIVFFFFTCSEPSSGTGSENANTDTSAVENLNSAPLGSRSSCARPLAVFQSNAAYQSEGNYQFTYTWNSVNGATSYEFGCSINGVTVFQNLAVADTFITFSLSIAASDSIKASVVTVCGTAKSNAKESAEIVYMDAVNTDEIIFLVDPNTSVDDICARSCEKLFFAGSSFKNSDGSDIPLGNPEMKGCYFDFNLVKTCIQCSTVGAPLVDPTAFNNCLKSQLNKFWLYDPGAYTICP